MITIVFVGENSELIRQLRAGSDAPHRGWYLHEASHPAGALALIECLGGADVVVTGMDMAAMDGAEFLTVVRDRFPATARIVLSRRSSREALLRVVGPAHQYLSMPIDVEEFSRVIEHVRGESVATLREPIRSLIGQADQLPSPPDIFRRLMAMVDSDDWTIADVADLLSSDVALTAEIMKLVNSTFFGFFGEVTSVERAVALLGVDLVRSIVLGSKLFATHPAIQSWLDLDHLDRRSKAVAHGARVLALRDHSSPEVAAAAHLAGMVAEIGMLVMARVPGVLADDAAPLNRCDMPEVEQLLFGGDRFEVGCQLLRLWGFGSSIIDAIDGLRSREHVHGEGLAWYLSSARRLIIDEGFDPMSFSLAPGESAEFDHAVELLRHERASVPA